MAFVVYKSSAGSGKTYTLVKEYLKLVLTNPSPFKFARILAITFTNKAAAEMKERVLKALATLAAEATDKLYDEKYLLDISSATRLPIPELQKRAKEVLATILHHYSDFSISTIDSFVHRVVKAFAYDLGIPLSFTVQLDQDKLLDFAVDELIARAGAEGETDLTTALLEFTKARTDSEKKWAFRTDLKDFAKTLLTTEGKLNTRKIKNLGIADIIKVRKEITAYINQYQNQITAIGQQALGVIEQYDIPPEAFYQGKRGIYSYFLYLKECRTDMLLPNTYVVDTISNGTWYPKTKTTGYEGAIDAARPTLEGFYNQALALVTGQPYERFIYYIAIKDGLFSLAVLNELQKIIDLYRRQTGNVHISEFNDRLATVVQHEPIPFVYERLGERYEHYLIDEFQDTSTTQWENLLPLVDNALAIDGFNMVVGDGKQAIYRWRGGNVEQFANLPKLPYTPQNPLLAERAASLERAFEPKNLDRNFRSQFQVINFNNAFFEFVATLLGKYEPIYHQGSQLHSDSKPDGLVEVTFVNDGKANPRADVEQLYCQATLARIQRSLADGFRLKDMAVLVRTNKVGAIIADYLSQNGIAVVSADSLFANASPQVRMVLAYFAYYANPKNQLAAAELLEHLLYQQNKTSQLQTILHNKQTNPQAITDALESLCPGLLNLSTAGLSLYEFYELTLRTLGLAETPNAYLLKLSDCIINFTGEAGNSLGAFVEWWVENKEKVTVSAADDSDAVRVMTIHKSKGLQFPVVIIPFADWKLAARSKPEWITNHDEATATLPAFYSELSAAKFANVPQVAPLVEQEKLRNLLDNINLFYVAFTRPEERLHILTTIKERTGFMADYLLNYLKTKTLWEEGKLSYVFGKATPAKVKESTPTQEQYILTQVHSQPWQNRIVISTQAQKMWSPDDTGQQPAALYGRAMHAILERINTPADMPAAIDNALNEGWIGLADKADVETRIGAVLQNPDYADLFSPQAKVWAEREIILPDGSVQRPDRVVELPNLLIIADYKTGQPKPAHQQQIAGYAQTLQAMGYANIKTVLVYL